MSNLIILFLIPFGLYVLWHKLRHKRSFTEIARRAGLQIGKPKYIGLCAVLSLGVVGYLVLFPPSVEIFTREGSPQQAFVGLPLRQAIVMALFYGLVKTGFCEEFLFRGLIAGSLSRRMPLAWANLLQSVIFLLPHLLILFIMPEMWPVLPVVFVAALFTGWVRVKSESIIGPTLMHGAANVTMCLSVALRTAA